MQNLRLCYPHPPPKDDPLLTWEVDNVLPVQPDQLEFPPSCHTSPPSVTCPVPPHKTGSTLVYQNNYSLAQTIANSLSSADYHTLPSGQTRANPLVNLKQNLTLVNQQTWKKTLTLSRGLFSW